MTLRKAKALAPLLAVWNQANERARREYDLLPLAFAGHHPLCAHGRCLKHARGPRQRYCPTHVKARAQLRAIADHHPSTDYRAGANA